MPGIESTYQPQSPAVNKNNQQRRQSAQEMAIQKKVDRLRPLLAAMRSQTPDDPMKPADVIATVNQANFATTIEEMNGTIMAMNERSAASAKLSARSSATSMIGSKIEGYEAIVDLKEEGEELVAQIPFALPHDVQSVKVKIFDENGQPIVELKGGTAKGQHILKWDGKDANGVPYPVGSYNYSVTAIDDKGVPLEIQAMSQGIVNGVMFDEGDDPLLRIGGSSTIRMSRVRAVQGKVNEAAAAA